jgi:hypothetical protein
MFASTSSSLDGPLLNMSRRIIPAAKSSIFSQMTGHALRMAPEPFVLDKYEMGKKEYTCSVAPDQQRA